jgi:hypothetical protein
MAEKLIILTIPQDAEKLAQQEAEKRKALEAGQARSGKEDQ